MLSRLLLAVLLVNLVVCASYGPDTWPGRGSYTRADIVDSQTIYNSHRCNELLPETLELEYISGEYAYFGPYPYYTFDFKLSIGETPFTVEEYSAIPRYDDQIRLTNGRTTASSVYILYDGKGAFLIHLFFDTSSFRSTNPTSPDFVEKEICQVVFAQDNAYYYEQFYKDARVMHHPSERDGECDFLSNPNVFVTMETALRCFRSVPFNSETRDEIVDAIEDVMAFYVYQDANCDVSYGEDKIQMDFFSELDRIASTNYDNDFSLHQDITQVYQSMRDTHTIWPYPQCYRNWIVFQPFALSSYLEQNGKQVITISGNHHPEAYSLGYDINVQDYVGYIVLELDGTDAVEYLIDYADTYHELRDKAARFNSALSAFTQHNSMRYGIFEKALNWKLKNPITEEIIELSFEWLVLPSSAGIATNTQEFIEWCTTTDLDFACGFEISKSAEITIGEQADLQSASIGGYSLIRVNSEVGVFAVLDFASSWGFQHTMSSFAVLYLTSIHTYNFDRLIIDLSDNGGGYIFAGYFLASLVIPSIPPTKKINNYDIIHNELMDFTMDYIYHSGNETLHDFYLGIPSNLFVRASVGKSESDSDAAWYFNSKRYTRGGKTSTYSSLFEINWFVDEYVTNQLDEIHDSVEYFNYPIQDIELLSNGICFSTCSLFVHSILEEAGDQAPEIIGWGGIVGEPLDASSVPTNVISISSFNAQFSALTWIPNFPEELIPHSFPFVDYFSCFSPDSFQVSYAETYNEKDNPKNMLPLEFRPTYVDCRLNVWNAGDELYAQAAYAFYNCPSSDFDSFGSATSQDYESGSTTLTASIICLLVCLVTLM